METKQPRRGSVILLTAEDDAADTVRLRLDAMGADVSRIHLLEAVQIPVEDKDGKTTIHKRTFCLQLDVAALMHAPPLIPDCRLISIDPLSAYLGKTDAHKNADVRGVLTPLIELAQERRIAVLGIDHLNKRGTGPAIYRSMGSLAFVAAARAVWAVVRDKTDPTRRLSCP